MTVTPHAHDDDHAHRPRVETDRVEAGATLGLVTGGVALLLPAQRLSQPPVDAAATPDTGDAAPPRGGRRRAVRQ